MNEIPPSPAQAPAQAPVIQVINTGNTAPLSEKSFVTYVLLLIFFGYFGVHNFYIGRSGRGVIEIFTLGGCGILLLLDCFNNRDAEGKYLR